LRDDYASISSAISDDKVVTFKEQFVEFYYSSYDSELESIEQFHVSEKLLLIETP
jgi:hypothetical protein